MVRVTKDKSNGVELRRESKFQGTSIKTPLSLIYISVEEECTEKDSVTMSKINMIMKNKTLKDIIL